MSGRLENEEALWVSEGVNHMSSLRKLVGMMIMWPRMRTDLRASKGYVRHRVFFEFPRTIGLMVWWREEFDAWHYAKRTMHAKLEAWANSGASAGGWLILYRAHRLGPTWGIGNDTVNIALGRETPSE